MREQNVHMGHPAVCDRGIERIGDTIGDEGHGAGLRRHRRRPDKGKSPLASDRGASCAKNKDSGFLKVLPCRIQDAIAEGASESLLGTKQNEAAALTASGRLHCLPRRQQSQRLAHRPRDDIAISFDPRQQGSRLLRARRGDAAHGGHHGFELAHIGDLRDNIGKTLGHQSALG